MFLANLKDPSCWRWVDIFSSHLSHLQDHISAIFLMVSPNDLKIQLVVLDGIIVDACEFSAFECIRPGSEIRFARQCVKDQDRLIVRDNKLLVGHSLFEVSLSSNQDQLLEKVPINPTTMAVHASHVSI
jgi:hypothetical protein